MTKEIITEEDFHKKYAKTCFNKTWKLLDKKDRTEAEDFEMIHTAHASAFHWSKIGTAINFERGEWQISRVYATLNKPEEALYHAKRCLDICQENNIGDFDLAFAYEALARAYSLTSNEKKKEKYLQLAKETASKIKKKDDRNYFMSELNSIQ